MVSLVLTQGVQGLGCGTQCQSARPMLAHVVPWLVQCPVLVPVPGVQCLAPTAYVQCPGAGTSTGATGSAVPGCRTCRAMPVLAASCLMHSAIMRNTRHPVPVHGTGYR